MTLSGAVTVVCQDTETGSALLAPTSPLVSSVSGVGAGGTLHQTAGSTCKFNIITCTPQEVKITVCHRSTVAPSATTVTDKAKMDSEVRDIQGRQSCAQNFPSGDHLQSSI